MAILFVFADMQETDNVSGGEDISKCQNMDTNSYCCVGSIFSECNCSSGSGALHFQGTPSALTTIGFTPSTNFVKLHFHSNFFLCLLDLSVVTARDHFCDNRKLKPVLDFKRIWSTNVSAHVFSAADIVEHDLETVCTVIPWQGRREMIYLGFDKVQRLLKNGKTLHR